RGEIAGDIPIAAVTDTAPSYSRPVEAPPARPTLSAKDVPAPNDLNEALLKLMGGPNLSSRRWIWEQYDHMVMADTIGRPGGDAAVVRVHGTKKALAISADCNPRYCEADPFEGAKQAVVETWRNLSAVGATPLAITDCMNFGSPENPLIMGQFARAVDGIAAASQALNYPVVSGNVSFYNETNGKAIKPVPGIGGVGLLKNYDRRADIALKREGDVIFLIGETRGHLGASLFLKEVLGREEGAPPPVDLALEKKHGDFVRALIKEDLIDTAHDLSDGGLAAALSDMCLAGNMGAVIGLKTSGISLHAFLFGEDQARYLIAAPIAKEAAILEKAKAANISMVKAGAAGGGSLKISGAIDVALKPLNNAFEAWFKNYMESAT
ncbi:MAG TPA: AIR synthase related protein, partial [Sphingomonadales bacterium]|nr:AIR synthase related protein [Sphingomonadales bacterium]